MNKYLFQWDCQLINRKLGKVSPKIEAGPPEHTQSDIMASKGLPWSVLEKSYSAALPRIE
jgi:hypothetical protein